MRIASMSRIATDRCGYTTGANDTGRCPDGSVVSIFPLDLPGSLTKIPGNLIKSG